MKLTNPINTHESIASSVRKRSVTYIQSDVSIVLLKEQKSLRRIKYTTPLPRK